MTTASHITEASHEVYFQPSTLSVVGKGFYGVHDQGDLSFGVSSITMCQAGGLVTCVPHDHNVTSSGIIRTQNGDGAILWGGHCELSLLNIQKALGSHLLNRLTSETSGSFPEAGGLGRGPWQTVAPTLAAPQQAVALQRQPPRPGFNFLMGRVERGYFQANSFIINLSCHWSFKKNPKMVIPCHFGYIMEFEI